MYNIQNKALTKILYKSIIVSERGARPHEGGTNMNWYEVYSGVNGWDVYKVTDNGQCYQLVYRAKTQKGAEGWVKRKNGWLRRSK
jgi:hypothetical protein